MEFKIISVSEGIAVIEKATGKYLAINSGLKNKAFAGVDTSRLQSLPGLIIENDEIHNWKVTGVTEIEGIVYYYGPYIPGNTLPELKIGPQILLDLTSALDLIKEKPFPIRHFSLNSVYRADDGRILFFPPHLMDFLNSHRNRKNSLKMIDPWNNSKLGGEQGRSFTIAALAYQSISGEMPFSADSEEEIEKLISKIKYKSLLLKEPALKEDINNLIDLSLRGEGTLLLWKKVLENWLKDGLLIKGQTEAEKNRILAIERKKELKRLSSWKLENFFQRNKTKLLASLIGLIILGAVVQAPLSKYLAPPVTLGMTQREVIDLYYSSFKTLDTEALDDCITSQAGKGDINEISTIYVTSRVRTSYEGKSGLIDPEQWILDGRKPVEPGIQIWGISNLSIKQLSENTFEANYIKWQPAQVDDMEDTTPKMPEGRQIKDLLHVSLINKAWKIDQLNRSN